MVKEIIDATENAKHPAGSKAKVEPPAIKPVKEVDKLNEEGIKPEEKKDTSADKKEEKPTEPKKDEKKPEEGANALKTLDTELERRGRTRQTPASKLEESLENEAAQKATKPQEQSEALAYNLASQNGGGSAAYGTIYGPAGKSNDAASVYSRASGQAGRESEDHGQFYSRATRQNEGPESQYSRGISASPDEIRESIDPLAKLSAYARR